MPLTDQERQELQRLRQENEQLKKDYAALNVRAGNFARESFLVELLGKNQMTLGEYEAGLQEFDLSFATERFLLMGIGVDTDVATMLGEEAANHEGIRYVRFLIRNVLEELIGEKNICHVILVRGKLLALVNLKEEPEEGLASVVAAAQKATVLFETHYDAIVNFTLSRVHLGYDQLYRAYDDVAELEQYRTMAGDDSRVLQYDLQTEAHMPKERVEHFEFEHALGNYIQSGDYEAARALVHKMLNAEFNHSRPTVQVFMIRANGIINDILHVFDSFEEYFSPEFLVELQAGPRIVNATSLSEISRELDDIFDAIIARQQAREQEPAWIQKAVEYIDENFADQNLNVANVADAVGINPVYLSRMLKQYRNIRPLEYIHQKRIEQAKILLGQGITVKDTLTRVGYSSALTMNRAFRRFENTTPGAFYREKL